MKYSVLLFQLTISAAAKGELECIHSTSDMLWTICASSTHFTPWFMLSSSMYIRAYFFTEEGSQLPIIDNLAPSTGRLSLEHLPPERLYLRLCLARCRLYIVYQSLEIYLNSAIQLNSLFYFDGQRPDGRLMVTFFASLLAIDSPK